MKRWVVSALMAAIVASGCEKPEPAPEKKQMPPEEQFEKFQLPEFRKPAPDPVPPPPSAAPAPGKPPKSGGNGANSAPGDRSSDGRNNGGTSGGGEYDVPHRPVTATEQEVWRHVITALRPLIVGKNVVFAPPGAAGTSLTAVPGKRNEYVISGVCEITDDAGNTRKYRFCCNAYSNKYEAAVSNIKFTEIQTN